MRWSNEKWLLLAATGLITLSADSFAGTWVGGTGGTNNYNLAGNWSPAQVPTAFTGSPTADINSAGANAASIDSGAMPSITILNVGSSGTGGVLNMQGGSLAMFNGMFIGNGGTGVINQSGGSMSFNGFGANDGSSPLTIGNGASGNGTYNMSGAAVVSATNSPINIGTNGGIGLLTLASTGTPINISGTNGVMTIGTGGTVSGYGTVSIGSIVLNGTIRGNGGGSDHDLIVNKMTSTVDNTTTFGVYATNHGRVLTTSANLTGNVSYTAYDNPSDATPDMVNSVGYTLKGLSVNSTVTTGVLSLDRTNVAAAPSGITFDTVWSLSCTNNGFTDSSLIFRYDDSISGTNAVSLYKFVSGSWQLVSAAVDDQVLHTLSLGVIGSGIGAGNGFSNTTIQYAAGFVTVPEPASLGLCAMMILPLLRRRRPGN